MKWCCQLALSDVSLLLPFMASEVCFICYECRYIYFLLTEMFLQYHFSSLHFLFVYRSGVSWRKHMVGLIQPITLYLWLWNQANLYLGYLLIDERLVLPFYLWFFVCFTFPLFFFSLNWWFCMVFFSFLLFFMFYVSALDLCFMVTMRIL